MKVAKTILDLVGNTPILKLGKLTADLKCNVLAKLEYVLFDPVYAAAVMASSSVTVISNAALLKRFKPRIKKRT